MARDKKSNLGVIILLVVIVLALLQSGAIPFSNPIRLAFADSNANFSGAQRWTVFDSSSRITNVLSSDTVRVNFFGLQLLPADSSLDGRNKGYIQDFIWFKPDTALPGYVPSSLTDYGQYDVFVFTRKLSATVTINGQTFASPSYVPWSSDFNSNPLNAIAQAYSGVLGEKEAVSFITGDAAGTMRGATIYFLLRPDMRPQDCVTYPQACVDLSNLVSQGQDFTIGLSVTEVWHDYETVYDPLHLKPDCSFRLLLTEPYCSYKLTQQTVTDNYSMTLTNFGYFTTTNGFTSFVQTQYSTAQTTVVIHITTTTEGTITKIIVVETHQNTTLTGTDTVHGPATIPLPDACTLLPFLCNWKGLGDIPLWAIVVVVILIIIILLAGRGRGEGGGSPTINIQARILKR